MAQYKLPFLYSDWALQMKLEAEMVEKMREEEEEKRKKQEAYREKKRLDKQVWHVVIVHCSLLCG